MTPHDTVGCLITFCGLDGCGKSTMIQMLTEELKKEEIPFLVTKQPTEKLRKSPVFRAYQDNPDPSVYEYRSLALMAAADRIQHAKEVVLPALREGMVVISDRYFYSCLANLRARGYTTDGWIYEIAANIPAPDMPFFLDISAQEAIRRVRERPEEKERYIDIPLQYRLSREYKAICGKTKGYLISSNRKAEETFSEIKKIVMNQL